MEKKRVDKVKYEQAKIKFDQTHLKIKNEWGLGNIIMSSPALLVLLGTIGVCIYSVLELFIGLLDFSVENSFILTVGSATGSTWFMGFIQGLKKGNEDLEILYQLRIDWLEKELENLIN